MPPSAHTTETEQADRAARRLQVLETQLRLLFDGAKTGAAISLTGALLLAYVQSMFVQKRLAIAWFSYMLATNVVRFLLARQFWSNSTFMRVDHWRVSFAVGAGLAGTGWGGAALLLYPETVLIGQVFLIFTVGGMMLGAGSLLAARPESFLAFLLPSGLIPAVRLISESDREHVAMGLLATLFTVSVVITTWRLHKTITTSIDLQFRNEDLVRDLTAANAATETLNQQLELRVRERTMELEQTTLRLRTEIEQRSAIEEELLRARKLESLGVLAGGIAHDFNNFLTVILGNVELARMELQPDDPVQTILDETSSACQRASLLSSQLLTFAKGGAPVRRVTSVATILQESVQLARAGAPVIIELDIPEDLWFAEVDAGQIGQVLHNILLNAKQAMGEGGRIKLHARNIVVQDSEESRWGPHVSIAIRDSGPGIDDSVLSRIFDPYFSGKQGGSGLGLATAYAIVSKHQGRIQVESKIGEGTVFTIELPASEQISVAEVSQARPQRGHGRLLVMDDENSVRTLAARVLTSLGYEVCSASDGAEAIALYEAERRSGRTFDAVLLDLTVTGGMGGIEAAARLKELDSSAKLIVSSGYSDAAVMSNYREYGFIAVVPKPWNPTLLSEVIGSVLTDKSERTPD